MPNEIKPEQVPKEVIAAFREALKRDDTSFEDDFCAGLNGWPGVFRTEMEEAAGVRRRIILPLPQEKTDG